jgi:hypothetical protein
MPGDGGVPNSNSGSRAIRKIEFNCNYLRPEELMTWFKKKRPFFLIHTLTYDHFQKNHLPGAQNACVFEITFLDQMNSITNVNFEDDELQPV